MELMPGFNVRTYGVLLSKDLNQVLLVEEMIEGRRLLKFPGGGIELGEGPAEALKREFKEELEFSVEVESVFYVSPNFHVSYFRPQQFLGLYWRLRWSDLNQVPTSQNPNIKAHWKNISALRPEELTHPLDQEVVRHLLSLKNP